MNNLANTAILSNFTAVNQLDRLRRLTGSLHIPIEVYDEIVAGREAGYAFYDEIEQHIHPFAADGWLRLVTMADDELKLLPKLPSSLHRGEAACLVIARSRSWGFFTDDRAARRQAKTWNIAYSGTLGLLLLAIQNDLITVDDGNHILQQMIALARYRSPSDDLRSFL